MEIYSEENRPDAIVYPDATSLPIRPGQLIRVKRTDVLFPEAASDFEATNELRDVLEGMRLRGINDRGFVPDINEVNRFGIIQGAGPVVNEILRRYVEIARTMYDDGRQFGARPEYNFQGFSQEGVNATYSHYGLYHATSVQASKNRQYRDYLMNQGQGLLGSRHGFFVNPISTSVGIVCSDGVLFVSRSNDVADYPNMLHTPAAGHHRPVADETVSVRELINQQVVTETGISEENISNPRLNCVAFACGNRFPGTEKVELAGSIKVNATAAEVYDMLIKHASHKWETHRLCQVDKEDLPRLISDTENATSGSTIALPYATILGHPEENLSARACDDGATSNSGSYWVPVGLVAMRNMTV
ncbi:MAG: hypothetical protein WCT46_05255 [Candidatus Gracilibacteria bacterium]